ncbi:stalk domain-containing protein [Paenibacillus alba]|uniref:Stalk domain-containing protein n=1 Tax=Paenibacillus alba TaxID=1197127 RepID=A0ABU6FWD9_9BACL|nr:stalk domain-containing protein [Paenibacillus alba]MEC0225674.1 stalk domain-containing protein [Paenibacillus alba]
MMIKNFGKHIVLGVSCFFLSIQPAFAVGSTAIANHHEMKLRLNEQVVTVNGQNQTLAAPPTLMNNVTMVPLRFVAESLGTAVKWDELTRTITLSTAKTAITLTIDSKDARINGVSTALEQPATIINNTTMVPLRFISENMDQKVSFDSATLAITITSKAIQPVAVQTKRDKPTVDNLSIALPSAESNYDKIRDIISDSNSNVYMIDVNEKDYNYRYGILSYNQKEGDGRNIQKTTFIDGKFNIQYKDSRGNLQRVPSNNITPKKLFYNSLNSKLYLIAQASETYVEEATVIYEVLPEVKMVTYNLDSSMNEENNFQSPSETKVIGRLPDKQGNYVSVNMDDNIYVLDKENKKISKINLDGTVSEVAKLHLGQITGAATRNGYFYISDAKKIYRVDVSGNLEEYVNIDNLTYNKGLFDPKTQTYEPPAVNYKIENGESIAYQVEGPSALNIGGNPLFTIDNAGNIIIYDSLNRILRRINVF